jgi:hypothetical protein
MQSFLQRISSRKFLVALMVQIAAVAAIAFPQHESQLSAAAVRIAALITMLLAAMGYGKIQAALDASGAESPADSPADDEADAAADSSGDDLGR